MLELLRKKKEELAQKAREIAAQAELDFAKVKLAEEQRNERYDMCKSCEHFLSATKMCKRCGCFMAVKTYLPAAECPVGKWKKIVIVPISQDQ